MKTIKRYLSILLVLSIMLCSTSMFTVNAAQVTETEDFVIDTEANLGGEDELQPMVANTCVPPQPTSIVTWSEHALGRMDERNMGQDYLLFIFSDAQPVWNASHGTWNYSDGEATICVTSSGVVTTVYWNNEY